MATWLLPSSRLAVLRPWVGADGANLKPMADEAVPAPGEPAAEPRVTPLWVKLLVVFGSIAIAVGIAGTVIRVPYDTLSPGSALNLAPLVTIKGAKTYSNRGDVMLLFVRERDHVNLWSWLQAKLDPNIDLVKESLITGGASEEESNAAAVSDMTQSQVSAKAAALTALGYHLAPVPGLLVTAVLPSKPAGKLLRPDDQILAADGHVLERPSDLAPIVQRHAIGSRVALRIDRAGHVITIDVGVVANGSTPQDRKEHVIGVFVLQTFRFPARINIDTSNISGPSAGLAMTLAIIDDLTPGDLTGGKRVAVTGTITPQGQVGEIGGLPQKAVAAKAAHAQIFIVPVCVHDPSCDKDLKTAKARVGSHVDVEPVATLAQALAVLRKAGGAPLPARATA